MEHIKLGVGPSRESPAPCCHTRPSIPLGKGEGMLLALGISVSKGGCLRWCNTHGWEWWENDALPPADARGDLRVKE
jgi:hypothetical protein